MKRHALIAVVTFSIILAAQQWPAGDQAASHYSPLVQITSASTEDALRPSGPGSKKKDVIKRAVRNGALLITSFYLLRNAGRSPATRVLQSSAARTP